MEGLWTALPRWLSQDKNLTAMTHKSRQVTGDLPLSLGRKGNLIFGTKLYAEHTIFRALGPLQSFLEKQASMLTIQYARILATCKNASLEREIQS